MKRWLSLIAAIAAMSLANGMAPASAEDAASGYPNRFITLVMAFPPGGGSDAAARLVAEHMSATLGQPIVMEATTGAGGMIAAARVARAEPDGYTIMVHQAALAAGVSLFKKLSFDPLKDLAPIGLITSSPTILIGSKTVPANTLPELQVWMKRVGNAKFASPGPGTLGHLSAAQLMQAFDAKADLIPYRGGGPAIADVIAGHSDLVFVSLAQSIPLVRAGTIKGFGVTSPTRVSALPDVPSLVEEGYRQLDIQHWHGLFAPAGTPRPIIDKLNAALRKAIADPNIRAAFDAASANAIPADQQTPEALGELLRSEIKRWGEVIQVAHIEIAQ